MKVTHAQVRAFLLKILLQTQEEECCCEHCSKHLAEFAETTGSGLTSFHAGAPSLARVGQHLKHCPSCCEELGILEVALGEDFLSCGFA